ncbi:hypothetical protein [Fischerella sp. PCC 9605]|nr:hypothetical protein [Fischerella sp. PCC 9605]
MPDEYEYDGDTGRTFTNVNLQITFLAPKKSNYTHQQFSLKKTVEKC